MGKNANWEKLCWLVSQNFYWNMIRLPGIQTDYIYKTIEMTCTSEFNLKKWLETISHTKKSTTNDTSSTSVHRRA